MYWIGMTFYMGWRKWLLRVESVRPLVGFIFPSIRTFEIVFARLFDGLIKTSIVSHFMPLIEHLGRFSSVAEHLEAYSLELTWSKLFCLCRGEPI